ncbi:transglycosylase SLT domain-containing protein [Vibrio sp. 10N.286.52.F8]|uniref:transglycosylase SLT domain-containing protein n=1 Tax=Vibrio sp. 10N.286.52.F8 TaxID=3229716 RepID=UPI00354BC06D
MKHAKLSLCALMLSVTYSPAPLATPGIDSQEFEQWYQTQQQEFEQWYKEQLSAFNQWQIDNFDLLDNEVHQQLNQWGEAQFESGKTVVLFDSDQETKLVVDLESNHLSLSHLSNDKNEQEDMTQLRERMHDMLVANQELLNDLGMVELPEIDSSNIHSRSPQIDADQQTALEAQIRAQTERQLIEMSRYSDALSQVEPSARMSTFTQQQQAALKANEQRRLEAVQVQASQANVEFQRVSNRVYDFEASLPTNSVAARAERYQPLIRVESQKQNADEALLMAITHTESHFNPKAKSPVPAYGLMQVVPQTAGHDVNRLVRKIDKPMNPNELYDVRTNIETGTAYIQILDRRYLRQVTDPKSRLWCVIAAYNTGSGNVARAFGHRTMAGAAPVINKMTSEQVYQHLIQHLPYEETRNYLPKVRNKMRGYAQQNNQNAI